MVPLHSGVHIQGADFFAVWQGGQSLESLTHLEPNVQTMLDELAWWTNVLKAGREEKIPEAA